GKPRRFRRLANGGTQKGWTRGASSNTRGGGAPHFGFRNVRKPTIKTERQLIAKFRCVQSAAPRTQSARTKKKPKSESMKKRKPTCHWTTCVGIMALVLSCLMLAATDAQAQAKKPNILVLWGDDVGVHNISAYNHGIMGYRTPDIDRIAKEGAL